MSSEQQSNDTQKLAYPADELRTPVNVLAPDKRNFYFGVTSIEILYKEIQLFQLNPVVPDDIKIQFDTARNLYLHSFYVYRFYVIVQSQVLSTLEFAIRDCIGKQALSEFKAQEKRFSMGLRLYMEYLARHQLIQNEDFPIWHTRNRQAAEEAYRAEVLVKMKAQGLTEYQWDESQIDESAFDVEWNYVEVLCETIPKIRNDYAHGSKTLHNQVLRSFQNISIIINKMYERVHSRKSESNTQ
jgi:hypothetical protein